MPTARIPQPLPSVDYLRECFSYDPDTGILTWKPRPREHFRQEGAWKRATNHYAGRPAGTLSVLGYIDVSLDNRRHKVHRLAWALHYGEYPKHVIDHIDLNKGNNRISNLRDVTDLQNSKGMTMPSSNKSEVIGVSWFAIQKRWRSRISVDGKCLFLGYFDTKAEAAEVRKRAEVKYGFSPDHGSEDLTVKPDLKPGHQQKLNTSGKVGVSLNKRTNRWHVNMYVNKVSTYLGSFVDKDAAIACREAAEIKYGYKPRRGTGAPILPA